MKKILITGGGSGLGRELAKVYSKDNYIILVGRRIEKLNETLDEMKSLGGIGECIPCDISSTYDVNNLVNSIKENYEKIDILINNAGVGYFSPIDKITLNEVDKMLDINIKGTIIITKGLIPYINNKIINIISTAGLKGKKNETVYCASKFAVRGFTEALQKEYEDKNIQVTAVYMGGMDTPFWDESDHINDKSRLKSPEQVAKAIKENDSKKEIFIDK